MVGKDRINKGCYIIESVILEGLVKDVQPDLLRVVREKHSSC